VFIFEKGKYSQTWANDQLLSKMILIFRSHIGLLLNKNLWTMTTCQQQLLFWGLRVIIVQNVAHFYSFKLILLLLKNVRNFNSKVFNLHVKNIILCVFSHLVNFLLLILKIRNNNNWVEPISATPLLPHKIQVTFK